MKADLLVQGFTEAHQHLRSGALLVRTLAIALERKDGFPSSDAPALLRFIADQMIDRLELLDTTIEELQAALGGLA